MKQKQFLASTRIDKHNTIITLQALEGIVEQFKGHRKPAVSVQHDRTVPPMGTIVSAHIQLAEDGHHELFAEYDVFPAPIPVTLSDGTEAFEQHSDEERYAFATANIDSPETISVAVDDMNFESHDQLKQYYNELNETLDEPIQKKNFGRKALINDPEIVITLSAKAVAICLLIRVGNGVAEAVSEIAKEETKKLYTVIRTAITKFASYARPKNRPTTYVLQVPGTPNIEFVARSSNSNEVIIAFTNGSLSSVYPQLEGLRNTLNPEFVQFILSDKGIWHFNYLLTHDGSTIGTRQAYTRRATLLKEIEEVAKSNSSQVDPLECNESGQLKISGR